MNLIELAEKNEKKCFRHKAILTILKKKLWKFCENFAYF